MYKTTIGLEVHAELNTKSKMFCGCKNDPHQSEPNTNICPVCLAHPGTLPVPNQAAVGSVLTFGAAVDGTLADYSEFDRKNYFYPDIPKAYQISQYAFPFVTGGEIAGVALTRVHLEEDTARSQHDKGDFSLVDFNRAGVPLMELVTEPVIHSAKEAGDFARELQLLLRTLGISNANMEKGELRIEANISVSQDDTLGTKVEVKNLNSFKAVESAIDYEVARHISELEKGNPISQETRGWDESKQKTFSQRNKETAKDYRYFPDPDIPKLKTSILAGFSQAEIKKRMPLLPREKREKYGFLGLPSSQIEVILQSETLSPYFERITNLIPDDKETIVLSANYLVTDFLPLVGNAASDAILTPDHFVELVALAKNKKITSRVAKDILIETALNDTDVMALIKDRGLLSEFSSEKITEIVKAVIEANPGPVAEYQSGKTAALQFLLGQAMKETRGAADPVKLRQDFEDQLS